MLLLPLTTNIQGITVTYREEPRTPILSIVAHFDVLAPVLTTFSSQVLVKPHNRINHKNPSYSWFFWHHVGYVAHPTLSVPDHKTQNVSPVSLPTCQWRETKGFSWFALCPTCWTQTLAPLSLTPLPSTYTPNPSLSSIFLAVCSSWPSGSSNCWATIGRRGATTVIQPAMVWTVRQIWNTQSGGQRGEERWIKIHLKLQLIYLHLDLPVSPARALHIHHDICGTQENAQK